MQEIRRYQVYRVREGRRSGLVGRLRCLLRRLAPGRRLRPAVVPVPVSPAFTQAAQRVR